ncbi:MAG TPA: OmpA family protein [Myxococcota bacterium]
MRARVSLRRISIRGTSLRMGLLVVAAVSAASLGCVSRGNYDSLAAQSDKTRAERDALADYTRALERQLESVNASRDELSAQLAVTEVQVAELRDTYDKLIGELHSELASGQIEIQQLVDGIRLAVSDELLFPSGSADLDSGGRELLIRVANQIGDEQAIVAVEGHTDNVRIGSALRKRYTSNWELAAARAAGVVRLLNEQGIPGERLRAVSRGPFAPVASNDTSEGRARNRRTEIVLRPVPAC